MRALLYLFFTLQAAVPAAEPHSTLTLPELVERISAAVEAPAVELHADGYSYVEGSETPVLTDRYGIHVAGHRSRVEHRADPVDGDPDKGFRKKEVAVFDGAEYRKLATFLGTKGALGWQGREDLNAREIGAFLLGGLSLKRLDALREASSYSLHLDTATGLYEVSTPDEPECKFFVDRDHGYLIKRVEYRDDSDTLIRVCVVDFRKTQGRWWPAEQRIDAYLDDALEPDSVRKITAVTLNPPIADDQFRIEFPKDARIMPAEVSTLEIAQALSESGLGMPPEGHDSVNAELETIPEHTESKPAVGERATVPKLPRPRHVTEPAQPRPVPRSRLPIWIGAGIFVMVAGAGAYWRFRRKRR